MMEKNYIEVTTMLKLYPQILKTFRNFCRDLLKSNKEGEGEREACKQNW